jgi:hypothetical protein
MSPRHNRRNPEDRPVDNGGVHGAESVEEWPDGDWVVRSVAGAAGKTYRCPGCDQEIPAGVAHLVAWPSEGGGPDDRRHWHRPCWNARLRRGVKVHRSKNAPRYG